MTDDAAGHLLHNIFAAPSEPGPPYTHTVDLTPPDPAEAVAWLRGQIESDKAAAPWRPWALQRDVIADCEAKLAILDEHGLYDVNDEAYCRICGDCPQVPYPCRTVSLLAAGFRHREGYARFWGTPVTHTLTEDGQ